MPSARQTAVQIVVKLSQLAISIPDVAERYPSRPTVFRPIQRGIGSLSFLSQRVIKEGQGGTTKTWGKNSFYETHLNSSSDGYDGDEGG